MACTVLVDICEVFDSHREALVPYCRQLLHPSLFIQLVEWKDGPYELSKARVLSLQGQEHSDEGARKRVVV